MPPKIACEALRVNSIVERALRGRFPLMASLDWHCGDNACQSLWIISLVGETLSSCGLAFHRMYAAASRHAVS
jgi:hypothetical protein